MAEKEKQQKKRPQSKKGTDILVRKYDTILNIRLNSTDIREVLKFMEERIVDKRRFFIVTPNPEIVTLAQSDPVLLSILNSADLSLPDGIGLIWASKWRALWARSPFAQISSAPRAIVKKRVSGIDVMEALVKKAAERAWKVFLLGGRPGIAAKAAQRLSRNFQFPISNFQWDEGPWLDGNGKPKNRVEEGKERGALKKINEFRPDLLFVGFGAPKQEKWVATNYNKIQTLGIMVVGGAFDYLSGSVPRAPRWLQDLGFEWLFRLIVEPRRAGRQLSLLKFIWLVLTERNFRS